MDLESHSYERLYDLLYSGNLDFILTMNFPEMEKLHSDLEVMEICQVPQAVIYPKEFGTKKDIADFQDSVFICQRMHRWNIPGKSGTDLCAERIYS